MIFHSAPAPPSWPSGSAVGAPPNSVLANSKRITIDQVSELLARQLEDRDQGAFRRSQIVGRGGAWPRAARRGRGARRCPRAERSRADLLIGNRFEDVQPGSATGRPDR